MTKNQQDKILNYSLKSSDSDLVKSETFFKGIENAIAQAYYARVWNNYTRQDVADYCDCSLSSIQRLEQGNVIDLNIIFRYIHLLKELPVREKRKVPKWIYNK